MAEEAIYGEGKPKPACSQCTSRLVFICDRLERGGVIWKCFSCGHEWWTPYSYPPLMFPLRTGKPLQWRKVPAATEE